MENIWNPKRVVTRKTSAPKQSAIKPSTASTAKGKKHVTLIEVPKETPRRSSLLKQDNNPFRDFQSSENLTIRCQNELSQLISKYQSKFRKAETIDRFGDLIHDPITDLFFNYKPIVLVIGEKGVGKTTFINWLLGWKDYPTKREAWTGKKLKKKLQTFHPTEHFIVLERDNYRKKLDGGKLVELENKPFTVFKSFQPEINSTMFLLSFPGSQVLKDVTIIDTPSSLGKGSNPTSQFVGDVIETLMDVADRIYFLIDGEKIANSKHHNVVLTDENIELSYLLNGDEKKVALVVTKSEKLTPSQVVEVEHKVIWSFSKLINCDHALSVFFGSFRPVHVNSIYIKSLIEEWHGSIYEDFQNMQRHKVLHVADTLVLRGQQLITFSYVIRLIIAKRSYFRKNLIMKHLTRLFAAAQEICRRPLNEFPSIDIVSQKLQPLDLSTLQLPTATVLQDIEKAIYREIPEMVEDHVRIVRRLLEDLPYTPQSASFDLEKF